MTEIKVWARLGAFVIVPSNTNLSDLDNVDFEELYAENKLSFDGDSYVPEECDEDVIVVEDEDDGDFSLQNLGVDDDTEMAFSNVLQSIENIRSYVSYARCDDGLKQEIADMSERFLKAVKSKMKKELG